MTRAGRVREGDGHGLQGRQGDREGVQPVPAALQGGARPRRRPELPPEGGLRHERRVGPLAANPGEWMSWLLFIRFILYRSESHRVPCFGFTEF